MASNIHRVPTPTLHDVQRLEDDRLKEQLARLPSRARLRPSDDYEPDKDISTLPGYALVWSVLVSDAVHRYNRRRALLSGKFPSVPGKCRHVLPSPWMDTPETRVGTVAYVRLEESICKCYRLVFLSKTAMKSSARKSVASPHIGTTFRVFT